MNQASVQINGYLDSVQPWQRDNLVAFRNLVHQVVPQLEEAWKWQVPVFLVSGRLLCAMSAFQGHTKFNFFDGASLKDTHGLFNSGLDSKKHRSINLAQDQAVNQDHLKDLIAQAAARALAKVVSR